MLESVSGKLNGRLKQPKKPVKKRRIWTLRTEGLDFFGVYVRTKNLTNFQCGGWKAVKSLGFLPHRLLLEDEEEVDTDSQEEGDDP